jgi:hypothetical protein
VKLPIRNGGAKGGRGDFNGLNGLGAAHLARGASRRLPEWLWGLAAIFGSLG